MRRRFCCFVRGRMRHAAAGLLRSRFSFHHKSRFNRAPIVPATRKGTRIDSRCHPVAGPPAVAAMSDDAPISTRNPLRPTAATQRLSAVASASDPQLNNVVARRDGWGSLEIGTGSARTSLRTAGFPTNSPSGTTGTSLSDVETSCTLPYFKLHDKTEQGPRFPKSRPQAPSVSLRLPRESLLADTAHRENTRRGYDNGVQFQAIERNHKVCSNRRPPVSEVDGERAGAIRVDGVLAVRDRMCEVGNNGSIYAHRVNLR